MTLFSSNSFRRKAIPYLFISPFYLAFAVFGAFPVLFSLYLSFHRWNGVRAMEWVGLKNYIFVLGDSVFWLSLLNIVVMSIMIQIPMHCLALVCAYILHLGFIKMKEFFKTTYMFPHLTSVISITLVFLMFYMTYYGFFNRILEGLRELPIIGFFFSWFAFPVRWLEGFFVAKASVAFIAIWKWTGWSTILYLAGLQAIPGTIYEAAKIDGANNRAMFFRISLPLLKPMLFFSLSMSLIFGIQMFEEPLILFNNPPYEGGPAHTCLTPVMYIFRSSFYLRYFGKAAAAAYVLFTVIVALYMLNEALFKERKSQYQKNNKISK